MEFIRSDIKDKSAISSLKFGTSLGTWFVLFFHLVPTLIAIAKNLFGITPHQGNSTLSGIIDTFLYYILNPVIATLVVKWQNQKLLEKSLKFRKIYLLAILFVLYIFVLINILGFLTHKGMQ